MEYCWLDQHSWPQSDNELKYWFIPSFMEVPEQRISRRVVFRSRETVVPSQVGYRKTLLSGLFR